MSTRIRRMTALLLTALLLLQSAVLPAAGQSAPAGDAPNGGAAAASPDTLYLISGRVVDGSGNGVAGVTVTATAIKTPVIFIPGITGSHLREVGTDNDLWPGGVWGTDHGRLSYRPGERNEIFARDVISRAVIDAYGRPVREKIVYEPLLQELAKSRTEYVIAGDPTRQTESGCDMSQAANNPTLFVFAYDWRLSNDVNADRLKGYVACIHRFYPGVKIGIVAHSMGGLVARRYILKTTPDHFVQRLITVGTPWLGAPKFSYVIEEGDLDEMNWLASRNEVRRLLEAFPGAHELLPSDTYFAYAGMSGEPDVFIEKGWDINKDGNGQQTYDYNALVDYVNARFPQEGDCGNPTDSVCRVGDNNRAFHSVSGQDRWIDGPQDITYHYIVGLRSKADTIVGQVAELTPYCSQGGCGAIPVIITQVSRGDGTVPLVSARRAPLDQSPDGSNITIRRVSSYSSQDDSGAEHLKMLHNPDVLAMITEILDGAPDVRAAAEDETIPPAEPAYYLKVLGANVGYVTDDEGNITGIVSPTLTLREAGEVTFLPSSTQNFQAIIPTYGIYTVTFQSGDFPMLIDLVREGDAPADYAARWRDLEIPPNTAMQLILSPEGVQELSYDASGDGTPDTPVPQPPIVAEGPAAADTTPPTVTVTAATDQVVTISAEDETGVVGVYYSFDETFFQAYTGPVSAPYTATAVYAFADDTLANRSSVTTMPLTPDTTPPTTIIQVDGAQDNQGAFTGAVTVTLSAADTQSGVQSTHYSLDGGQTWQTYTTPFRIEHGQTTAVYAYSTDNAGNQETPQARTLVFTAPVLMVYLPAVARGGAQAVFGTQTGFLPETRFGAATVTYTATTGADGRYTIANLPAGTYDLVAVRYGWNIEPPRITVTVLENVADADFVAMFSPPSTSVIDDFEQYTTGNMLGGQGVWVNEYSCNVRVMAADSSWQGKIVRSDSCYYGQYVERPYQFGFTANDQDVFIEFSGRITTGSGNNSSSMIALGPPSYAFSFGLHHNPSLRMLYEPTLSVQGGGGTFRTGQMLSPGIWYDFRLEVDWSHKSSLGDYGIASLRYRVSGTDLWVSEESLTNVELHIQDPTVMNTLGLRMDGISSRRGELDNIVWGRGG